MSSNLTPGVYAIRQPTQYFLLVRPGAEHEYLFYQAVSAAEVAIWIADGVLERLPYPTQRPPSSSPRRPMPQPPPYLRLLD
ncbi:hypothetical protein LCGC14_1470940 [marine sediment metagenome]|uniref:Uncharacterized protein n=1 Tax=marine sediment metagenome TaxID=412755 RepID=A0A0F9LSV8_9ZZZZ